MVEEQQTLQPTDDVLQNVLACLTIFEQKLSDSELELDKSKNTEQRIKNLLNRQLADGLLSYSEYVHLNHVNSLWASTVNALVSYNLGYHMNKSIILTNLLDLFSLTKLASKCAWNILFSYECSAKSNRRVLPNVSVW